MAEVDEEPRDCSWRAFASRYHFCEPGFLAGATSFVQSDLVLAPGASRSARAAQASP